MDESLSPIDAVYDRNLVARKLKHGTKYEQLTALVFQVLDAEATVDHDVKLRGDGKRTVHQIDVRVTRGNETKRIIVECRDKEEPNKIGLDEARSFATVARQLGAAGVMVTTTDFTAGAVNLAADEDLQLMTLKPFLPADAEGRLVAIDVVTRAVMPVPDEVHISAPGQEEGDAPEGNLLVSLEATVQSGSYAATLRDLLASLMIAPLDRPIPEGRQTAMRRFDPPVVLNTDAGQLRIGELRVDYHVEVAETAFRVDAGRRVAELVLRSIDGEFDRVIWDEDLQRFIVDPTGQVARRNSTR